MKYFADWIRPIVIVLALFGAVLIGYGFNDLWQSADVTWRNEHWKLVLGLSSASVTGFLVLGFFQQGEAMGTIKLPGNTEFSGVVGAVVLWILVFISVVWAINLLAK